MPRHKRRGAKAHSDTSPIERVKLATAKARLAKIEAEMPEEPLSEYTRYEDIPPLSLEDRDRLKADLIRALTAGEERRKKEKYDWYMSMAHWAP